LSRVAVSGESRFATSGFDERTDFWPEIAHFPAAG
jgi:hypothetical protein